MNDKNIYQRINAVQQLVEYVKKDAKVDGGGAKYAAVTHDNVVSMIRKHLVDNGVLIVPDQTHGEILVHRDKEKGINMHLYKGVYAISFVNIDKPEDRITVNIEAHANDNGDKATGKAITYATKSAILKVFLLETGLDDESRTAEPEPVEPIRQAITDERLSQAISKINSGEFTLERLLAAFSLSPDQLSKVISGVKNDKV